MTDEKSSQATYAPAGVCFDCGLANEKGLLIRSFAFSDAEAVAKWHTEKHYEAFPGMLSGGIAEIFARLSLELGCCSSFNA
jgi:hypothetical protein